MTEITVERIERAINTTARAIDYPDLARRIMPTLERLEAVRDDLLAGGDPAKYEAPGKVAE
jgi:hypothetical protein